MSRCVRGSLLQLFAFTALLAAPALAGDKQWSVEDPEGDWGWQEVAIDVDEGTWMSVDVSPDGRALVFDLLGDLYTLPIAGGEATAITAGVAWDEQPRWSPDGTAIAFTSDRGGGDNIWIVDQDGANPQQVTKKASPDRRRELRHRGRSLRAEALAGAIPEASQRPLRNHRTAATQATWCFRTGDRIDRGRASAHTQRGSKRHE